MPTEVINATYEAAYAEASEPGSLSRNYTPNKYKRVSVEGAVSVEYASFGGAGDVQTDFAIVREIMGPLINRAAGSTLSGGSYRA